MKTLLAVAACLVVFLVTLALSSFVILLTGGVRVFLLQALLKPTISALVATVAVEKMFNLDNHLPFYALAVAVILFMGYLQVGRPDVFTPYNLLATGTFTIISIGTSYLAMRRIRRSR